MFSKTLSALALLAAAAQLVSATPPACLIAAVNTQQDPSDLKSVCGNSDMKAQISSACGDSTDDAMTAFSAVCKGMTSTSSSSSASVTGTATSHAGYGYSGYGSASTVMVTSTSYDTECGCTKTATYATSVPVGTGMTSFATGASSSVKYPGTGAPYPTAAPGPVGGYNGTSPVGTGGYGPSATMAAPSGSYSAGASRIEMQGLAGVAFGAGVLAFFL